MMADDTKILTVSYGSFSCTLEGFEDPLATMKEIAEYFQDLSASDRPLSAKTGPRGIEVLDPEDSGFRVHLRADDLSDATIMQKWADSPSYRSGASGTSGDESIADKLRRLRAVAAGVDSASHGSDYAEDENVEDFLANFVAHAAAPDPTPAPGETSSEDGLRARFAVDENSSDRNMSQEAAVNAPADAAGSLNPTPAYGEESSGSTDASEADTADGSGRISATDKRPHSPGAASQNTAGPRALRSIKTKRADPTDAMIASTLRQTTPPPSNNVALEPDSIAPDLQSGRIFDEAAAQLEEEDVNHRRSALQHLRAAVSATKAERRVGGSMSRSVDDQPYRLDLKYAVRPRVQQPSVTPRPAAGPRSQPAVLKLVASQRVDAAAPTIPGRTSSANLANPAKNRGSPGESNDAESTMSFSAFAQQKGATALADLLEAAGAYLADVKGTPEFSRQMLMQTLQEVRSDDFSREDGLRAFAFLLRQGKLRKLSEGRFGITDATNFRSYA